MKRVELVEYDGRHYPITVVSCDACQRTVDMATEPIIVDHSAITLIHPDGYTEMVHESNEPSGYFEHYCYDCRTRVASISPTEIAAIEQAVERRQPQTPPQAEPHPLP